MAKLWVDCRTSTPLTVWRSVGTRLAESAEELPDALCPKLFSGRCKWGGVNSFVGGINIVLV